MQFSTVFQPIKNKFHLGAEIQKKLHLKVDIINLLNTNIQSKVDKTGNYFLYDKLHWELLCKSSKIYKYFKQKQHREPVTMDTQTFNDAKCMLT